QIMQAQEPQPEDLLLVEQVPNVRAREPGAGGAAGVLVERAGGTGDLACLDVQLPLPGQGAAGARVPRPGDAVEHVDAALADLEDADRIADPHEVPRLVRREQLRRPRGRVEHLLARLADRQAAKRVAVEAELRDLLRAPAAEVAVGAALRDAEEELAG